MTVQRRYFVYAGLFLLMFINYLDRINLSVAAKDIATTYGLSPVELGYMFSSFLWTYLVFLIPMGLAADRFGGRAITYATLGLWSIAGIWTGLATSYASLFASRLVLGVGKSASYPSGGKIIREWAPATERGVATAFLNSGAYAGLSVGSIVVAWLITGFGWRESFFITGAMGLALAAVWFLFYRRPEQANWLSLPERRHILGTRDTADTTNTSDFNQRLAMRRLLASRSMWSLAITQGCAGYTLYLFMTWLPNYLAVSRGLDVLKTGFFSAVPYAMAVVIGLGLGWLSDQLIKRSGGRNGERRKLIAVILLLSSVILATPFVRLHLDDSRAVLGVARLRIDGDGDEHRADQRSGNRRSLQRRRRQHAYHGRKYLRSCRSHHHRIHRRRHQRLLWSLRHRRRSAADRGGRDHGRNAKTNRIPR